MKVDRLLAARLASHLLSKPAGDVLSAAEHMLAIQAQDFVAGRYALALRSAEHVTRARVDQYFNTGELVRSWTMRGTLHICRAEDVRWMVRLTRERTLRAVAPRLRELQIEDQEIQLATQVVADYLAEHQRAGRSELFAELNAYGIATDKQRGVQLLMVMVLNSIICLGPIPADAKLAGQDFVLLDSWVKRHHEPTHPLQELLFRYLGSHGPATLRDAAWYAGQTLTSIKQAASALGDQLVNVGQDPQGEDYFVATNSAAQRFLEDSPSDSGTLHLLGGFDEYYLSYANRTPVAEPSLQALITPGKNGIFLPIWLTSGQARGVWNAKAAPVEELDAALHQRYVDFRTVGPLNKKA